MGKKRRIVSTVIVCLLLSYFTGCEVYNGLFNKNPNAVLGSDFSITIGERVTLDGTGSSDPDGDTVHYEWSFLGLGAGSQLADSDLEGRTSSIAYFTPDVAGVYEVQLTVSDDSKSDKVSIRVTVNDIDLSYLEGEDAEGNIVVNNNSGSELVIYKGTEPVKMLPDDSSDFLINIDNPDSDMIDLRLYKLSDVVDDVESPESALLFKRWNIVLASDTEIEHRVTWRVEASTEETTSGTFTFAYVGGTENSVDVYLNSKTGSKIISLSPGQQNKRIGIDYGNYTVHYRYWESDPQTAEGITEIGWVETELVNDNEVPIYVILNASREERHLQVPHWNGGSAISAQYGTVQIRNNTSLPIQIWIGSQLIEQVMYTDEAIDNYSTIAANDVTAYTMPVGDYSFIAKDIITTAEVDSLFGTILADQQIEWTITE